MILLKASVAVANLGVDAADLVLDGVEKANAGVLAALATVDSLKVDQITIRGNLGDYKKSGVSVQVDYESAGRSHSLNLDLSTEDFTKNLGKQLLAEVL